MSVSCSTSVGDVLSGFRSCGYAVMVRFDWFDWLDWLDWLDQGFGRSFVGDRDDDVIIDLPSLVVGGNFILLVIIRLSVVIETNRDRFSLYRDILDKKCLSRSRHDRDNISRDHTLNIEKTISINLDLNMLL